MYIKYFFYESHPWVDAKKWLGKSGPALDNELSALLQAKCIVPGKRMGRRKAE